jgi:hypothetical protein
VAGAGTARVFFGLSVFLHDNVRPRTAVASYRYPLLGPIQ